MGQWVTLDEMYIHLTNVGIMESYTVWNLHGEISETPSQWQLQLEAEQNRASSSNPIMDFVQDAFPRESYDPAGVENAVHADPVAKEKIMSYQRLLGEAVTPLYEGSQVTALASMLRALQLKQSCNMADTSFNKWAAEINCLLPEGNKYPDSHKAVKKALKKIGMGYEVIQGCYCGCYLFYKEGKDLDQCPICGESRWEEEDTGGGKRIARKTVRYFPMAPRLQRLYNYKLTAKEMRWHGDRREDTEYLRHPADGEAWKDFDRSQPQFAADIRNVRLALASNGFNPYSTKAVPYSCWPVIAMPYNLPPSLCMKKEFNILVLLISGPKNPVVLIPTHLGIVMEYAACGELFERICNAGRFSKDKIEKSYLYN